MTAPPVAPADTGFSLDLRQSVALCILAVGLGLVIGFKLAGGVPQIIEKPVFVERHADCAECAEKKIQAQRSAQESVE